MPYFHELIDHDRGVYPGRDGETQSLCHILFDTKEQMDAYLDRFVPSKREQLASTYIYREWGEEQLSTLRVVKPQ